MVSFHQTEKEEKTPAFKQRASHGYPVVSVTRLAKVASIGVKEMQRVCHVGMAGEHQLGCIADQSTFQCSMGRYTYAKPVATYSLCDPAWSTTMSRVSRPYLSTGG